MVTYNFAIVYPLPLSPLIISSIDTFIDVKTLNGTYIDKMVEGKESSKDSENITVDGVRISIFGSPTDINVSIDAPPSA
ncbi:hypothetical protein C6352_26650 [Bacillus thuringiensis]|nr:hypothetical protein C6352_26650 [Bacillus thuringiensis]